MENQNNQWMSTSEVAEYLSVSKYTIKKWISEDKLEIPIFKLNRNYRFKRSDVENLIKADSQHDGGVK